MVHAVATLDATLVAQGLQNLPRIFSCVIGYSRPFRHFLFTASGYNHQGCNLVSDRQTCCLVVHAVTKLDAVLAAQGHKNFKHIFSSVNSPSFQDDLLIGSPTLKTATTN